MAGRGRGRGRGRGKGHGPGRKCKNKMEESGMTYEDIEFLEEDDPYATDDDKEKDEDYEPDEDENQAPKNTPRKNKSETMTKSDLKRKATKSLSKDDKIKFAQIIQAEEIIYNLNHKFHSNIQALTAAWDRVAAKMEKPDMYECLSFFSISKSNLY